jgi:parallel beta-helix repeat protein
MYYFSVRVADLCEIRRWGISVAGASLLLARAGVYLYYSSNNSIIEDNIAANNRNGIYLEDSSSGAHDKT